MPNRQTIYDEILQAKATSQDIVRRRCLSELNKHTNRDTILYASAAYSAKGHLYGGVAVMINTQDLQGFMAALHGLTGENLDLILHSTGGSMEAAEQIVSYLRQKYKHIRAIVPQNAMSAATMVACAADEIIMGKHSAIGPIDPQITMPTATGQFTAPAHAILEEFNQARNDVMTNPRTAALWVSKIQSYPHGLLQICQSTSQLAVAKVQNWLHTYMFAGKSGNPSQAIATWLGDAATHKSHGRPISIADAQQHGLIVKPLEADQDLQERVLSVFHSAMATFDTTNCSKIIENHEGRGFYLQVQGQ